METMTVRDADRRNGAVGRRIGSDQPSWSAFADMPPAEFAAMLEALQWLINFGARQGRDQVLKRLQAKHGPDWEEKLLRGENPIRIQEEARLAIRDGAIKEFCDQLSGRYGPRWEQVLKRSAARQKHRAKAKGKTPAARRGL